MDDYNALKEQAKQYIKQGDLATAERIITQLEGMKSKQAADAEDLSFLPDNAIGDYAKWQATGIRDMVTNFPSSAKRYGEGLYDAVTNPIDTAKGLANLAIGGAQKLIPGEQPQEVYADQFAQQMGDRYGSWDAFENTVRNDPFGVMADTSLVGGLGGKAIQTAGQAGQLARIPQAGKLAQAGKTIKEAGYAVDPVNMALNPLNYAIAKRRNPQKEYQSAAKFSTTLPEKERTRAIQTALDEKIPPTGKGALKMETIFSALDNEINSLIEKADIQGKVDVSEFLPNIKALRDKLARPENVTAFKDSKKAARILEAWYKNLSKHGKKSFTAKELQDMKVDLYSKSSYQMKKGKADKPENQTYKTLARSSKEMLEGLAPELQGINQRYGRLRELEPHLIRSAGRVQNRDFSGIGIPLKTIAGAQMGDWLGGLIGAGIGYLDNPTRKANSAIKINALQQGGLPYGMMQNNPYMWAARQGLLYDQ